MQKIRLLLEQPKKKKKIVEGQELNLSKRKYCVIIASIKTHEVTQPQ